MDNLKRMFYLKREDGGSLLLYDQLEIKPLGVNQLQDVKHEPADVLQLVVKEEEVPWSSSLTEQDPGPLNIKEEKEEVWTSQEGEQFYTQEETDISRLNVSVKSEEDEEKPQFSQLHQIKTEDNRETEPPTFCLATETKTESNEEDCKGPEPGRNASPNSNSQPHLDENASETSGDNDDNDDWNKASSLSECESEDREDNWKLRLVGKPAKSSFRCSVCPKQFVYKQSLKRHMTRHIGPSTSLVDESLRENQNGTAENCFPCSSCGKELRTKYGLKKHMMIHTGEKPFECDQCWKRFGDKFQLRAHLKRHSTQKFLCDNCGKTFSSSSSLNSHTRLHKTERPYKCSSCSKAFFLPGELRKHFRIHSGKKTFACSKCDKQYLRKHDLQRHMINHLGENRIVAVNVVQDFRNLEV